MKHARITLRYPASRGYVTYEYWQDGANKSIRLNATGNAAQCRLRILLPKGLDGVQSMTMDGKPTSIHIEQIETSNYATAPISLERPVDVTVRYK